jgi:hypothetical protein
MQSGTPPYTANRRDRSLSLYDLQVHRTYTHVTGVFVSGTACAPPFKVCRSKARRYVRVRAI